MPANWHGTNPTAWSNILESEDLLNSQIFLQRQELYKWLRGRSMDPLLAYTPEEGSDCEQDYPAHWRPKGDAKACRMRPEHMNCGGYSWGDNI